MRLLEVGELVEYYSRRYDPEPSHVGKVLESLPKGIPSYPHPMVKLEGKAGYLSAEHCMPAKVTRNADQPIAACGCEPVSLGGWTCPLHAKTYQTDVSKRREE